MYLAEKKMKKAWIMKENGDENLHNTLEERFKKECDAIRKTNISYETSNSITIIKTVKLRDKAFLELERDGADDYRRYEGEIREDIERREARRCQIQAGANRKISHLVKYVEAAETFPDFIHRITKEKEEEEANAKKDLVLQRAVKGCYDWTHFIQANDLANLFDDRLDKNKSKTQLETLLEHFQHDYNLGDICLIADGKIIDVIAERRHLDEKKICYFINYGREEIDVTVTSNTSVLKEWIAETRRNLGATPRTKAVVVEMLGIKADVCEVLLLCHVRRVLMYQLGDSKELPSSLEQFLVNIDKSVILVEGKGQDIHRRKLFGGRKGRKKSKFPTTDTRQHLSS